MLKQTEELARQLLEQYQHHADLAAFADYKLARGSKLVIGEQDPEWWLHVFRDCEAASNALAQAIKSANEVFEMGITLPEPDWARGMGVYLRDFVLEGLDDGEQIRILAVGAGLDWTRDDGDFVEPDPPTPEECFPQFPFSQACKLYILKNYRDILPDVKEDYIEEAEHQDGPEYWEEHFQADDGSIDKEAIAVEMVLYALNVSTAEQPYEAVVAGRRAL